MRIDPKRAKLFACRECADREKLIDVIRLSPKGDEPKVACERCGSDEFFELTGELREQMIDKFGPKSIESSRLHFCYRCRGNSFQVIGPGEKLVPCNCGSRYFVELIGPEKARFLRERLRPASG